MTGRLFPDDFPLAPTAPFWLLLVGLADNMGGERKEILRVDDYFRMIFGLPGLLQSSRGALSLATFQMLRN
jgi:hypothetical protein